MNCIIDAWQKHEVELNAYLLKKLSDPDLAKELLQETFLKAIRLGKKFCDIDNPRAWLYRVINNQVTDYLRKDKVRSIVSNDFDEHDISEHLTETDAEAPPVADLAQCLPIALQRLRAKDSQILRLCDMGGLTQVAYAERFDLSLPAVKSKIQRARMRLKKQLKSQCQILFDREGKVCCFTPQGKQCQ